VATTFYPLSYFAQRIGDAHIEVVCPLPDEADPSTWMPDTTAIQVYQQADVILVNGAGFEHWLSKVSLPNSKVVETTQPLREQLLQFEQAITHSHGSTGQHSHEGIDGHTWLDPQNAILQAGEIRQALLRLLPQAAAELTANADALAADLRELDAALRKLTETLGDRPLLASHPAYNYLAKRYGWKLTSLSLDPDERPSAETLAEVRSAVAKAPAHVLLWERGPRGEVAEAYQQEFGLRSVVFSPCETPTVGEDYLAAMQHNVTRLAEAIPRR
jgi:zinc transport system substrate-binding protein